MDYNSRILPFGQELTHAKAGDSEADHFSDLSNHKGYSGVGNHLSSDGRVGSGEDQQSPRFNQSVDFDQDDSPMNETEQTARQSTGAGTSVNTERLTISELLSSIRLTHETRFLPSPWSLTSARSPQIV